MEEDLHLGNVFTLTALRGGWLRKTVKGACKPYPEKSQFQVLRSRLIKNSMLFISIMCSFIFTSGHVSPRMSENTLLPF